MHTLTIVCACAYTYTLFFNQRVTTDLTKLFWLSKSSKDETIQESDSARRSVCHQPHAATLGTHPSKVT